MTHIVNDLGIGMKLDGCCDEIRGTDNGRASWCRIVFLDWKSYCSDDSAPRHCM